MNKKTTIKLLVALLVALPATQVKAQLFVGGPFGEGFSQFETIGTSFDDDPLSGDITGGGDVWIERDLEVGERIYARNLWSRDPGGIGRLLTLRSPASLVFVIDHDNNNGLGDQFEWFQDTNQHFLNGQLAELEPSGDFEIGGAYSSGVGTFDLAEAFLAGEELEAGDVVRVDPLRPNQVLRASGNSGVIGVVSSNPGIRLGSAIFSVDQLEIWGKDIEASFRSQEPALIQEAMALHSELGEIEQALEAARAAPALEGAPGEAEPDVDRVAELEGMLREAALDLFMERTVAQVALAGRVPVKIDLEGGPIRSGDYLSASDRPGLARKAVGPGPVIGVALEDSRPGVGTVLMLVQNGWFGGKTNTLAGLERYERLLAEQQSVIAAKDRQIAQLEERAAARLAALEARLRRFENEGRVSVALSSLPN